MPSISSTGQLANISEEMISTIRYTAEHNAPAPALFEQFTLKKGQDTAVFPKVGQVNVRILNESEEMTNEQDIGLATLSVSTNEVGGYIILSDKLLKRTSSSAGDLIRVTSKQFGSAEARLWNTDILGLGSALNGGTDLGSAGYFLTAANAMAGIAYAKAQRFGEELRWLVHPATMMRLLRELTTIGSGQIRPLPEGFSAEVLGKFWSGVRLGQCPFFETGAFTVDASDDHVSILADRGALATLKEGAPRSYKEHKNRRRAWELGWIREYIAFELDDTRGTGCTLDAATPSLA